MKKIVTFFIACSFSTLSNAQPSIQWQKALGGNSYDEAKSIIQTTDGGYIVAGGSASSNGDVFGHLGANDFWIIKLSSTGSVQWKKIYGGTGNDIAQSIKQTSDGGYIVVGDTDSNNYDVTGNHGGFSDGWVVKLSSFGSIQWQRALGGSKWDDFLSVEQTSDNGYIMTGRSDSFDGDLTENKGLTDLWVVKLNESGAIEWQKTYGGSKDDLGSSVKQCPDGGYVIVGETASTDGDVTWNNGNVDFWILKLAADGTLEWQKTYGGQSADLGSDIALTDDGGYVVTGYVGSHNTGDVTGHSELAYYDAWVLKLSSTGELEWQKTVGGTGYEYARAVIVANSGGYVVAGSTSSTDGDVSTMYGLRDFWVFKLDEAGQLVWEKSYGGTKAEHCFSIANTTDNGFIMTGYAWSTDGDVSGAVNLGRNEYWIVKLSPESTSPTDNLSPIENILEIFPNPARHQASVHVPSASGQLQVTVSDMQGRAVTRQAIANGGALDVAQLSSGLYQLAVAVEDGRVFWGKLEKL